jgi:hypothetical protein
MVSFSRFLTRRWLIAFLGAVALLFGLAMLHPYPRQSLFGPTIRGKPWCVWESAVRKHVQKREVQRPLLEKVLEWLNIKRDAWDIVQEIAWDKREFLPLLLALAEDADPQVRYLVLSWVPRDGKRLDPSILPMVKNRLDDDESYNRIEAAMALWQITKDKQAIEVMVRELKDTTKPRATVIRYIGEVCDECPENCVHLIRLADDPDVQHRAMFQFLFLGKKAIPSLLKALEDSDATTRACAATAVGYLGEEAKVAVPALERRLNDSAKNVRQCAAWTLKMIEPDRFRGLTVEP